MMRTRQPPGGAKRSAASNSLREQAQHLDQQDRDAFIAAECEQHVLRARESHLPFEHPHLAFGLGSRLRHR
jgi:hypothetical protein